MLYHYKKILFWTFAAIAVAFLCIYLYFTYLSINFSFLIQSQARALKTAELDYQNLEKAYISALHEIDSPDVLAAGGFSKISSPQFISRVQSVAFHH